MKKISVLLILFYLTFQSLSAHAALTIEITQGNASAIPIAIVPFENEILSGELTSVIQSNLKNSGQFLPIAHKQFPERPTRVSKIDFTAWKNSQVDTVVIGRVRKLPQGMLQVEFELVDVYQGLSSKKEINNGVLQSRTKSVLESQQFNIHPKHVRKLAHKISDIIYEKITGDKGIFSTKIVYVSMRLKKNGTKEYRLEISDVDGHNNKNLLVSRQPILSPDWSPDGRKIAYVSFETRKPQVFVQEVATGRRELIADFPGVNSAPTWAPDGQSIALAVSKDGNPEIYIIHLNKKRIQRITRNWAIDTEPNWAPDGKSLIFTSDRGGGPQIYQYTLASRKIKRITFDGKYNARGRFTPDGTKIIMVHRLNGKFHIALQDLNKGGLLILSETASDESPTVAPNGKMILYATRVGMKGVLSAVSMDGSVKLRLPSVVGLVKEPAWSPFING